MDTRMVGAGSELIAAGELRLSYQRHESIGGATPTVLLHGALGSTATCFADLIPELVGSTDVITLDMQGHGRTPDINRPLSYSAMAADVAAALDTLGIGVVNVVGYSMGGGIATELAVHHATRVRKTVVAGGAAFSAAGFHPTIIGGEPLDPDDHVGTPWHNDYLASAPDPSGWNRLVQKVSELDSGFTGWSPNEIRGFDAPTMFVVGDSDVTSVCHVAEFFSLTGGDVCGDLNGLPASRLLVLPATTHVGVLARWAIAGPLIADFLAAPSPAARHASISTAQPTERNEYANQDQ